MDGAFLAACSGQVRTMNRRQIMTLGVAGAGLGLGAALTSRDAGAGVRRDTSSNPAAAVTGRGIDAGSLDVRPDAGNDATKQMQKAVNQAAASTQPLLLAAGHYDLSRLDLPANAHLIGVPGRTVFRFSGGARFLTASNAGNVRLQGLVLDGMNRPMEEGHASGLFRVDQCDQLALRDITFRNSWHNGLSLDKCDGSIADCTFSRIARTGLFSIDATGLTFTHNTLRDCGNNAIQVWRRAKGDDGTIIAANRIYGIRADAGGSGQNGNGINLFRAGAVQVAGNRITDCAYSAIRGNDADNMIVTGNNCARIGEVALYAEFGFAGALMANNIIDGAASGIAATNFNEGGHLAIIQGNIIRNLKRRDFEPVDKRGVGIGVEADAVVNGNVIETAETAGIMIGWGRFLRDVSVTANIIRKARLGIGITAHSKAGRCLVTQNMISRPSVGAIRAMDHDRPVSGELTDGQTGYDHITLVSNIMS